MRQRAALLALVLPFVSCKALEDCKGDLACEEQVINLLTSQNNFICQVCNARLAISAQLAQLILVEPVAG